MKTRSLTEGAMLTAITILISIGGQYFGVPGLMIAVPLILLVYRHGQKQGFITVAAAALVASLVAGQILAALTIIIWGFFGAALGMALREKFSFPKMFATGVLASLVVTALNALEYSLIFGRNLFNDVLQMVLEANQQAQSMMEGMGMAAENLARYQQIQELAPTLMTWGLPALLLVSAVSITYLNLLVVRLILKRLGDPIPWIAPFSHWRLPPYMSLFLLAGMFLTAWGEAAAVPNVIRILGLNLTLIFSVVYLVLGLAIVWHYFQKNKVAGFLRGLFVFLLLMFSQPLVLILTFLGVLDGLFDFRKLAFPGQDQL